MTETGAKPMSKRGFFLRLSLWTLALGVVLLAVGWWLWHPVMQFGWLCLLLGVLWLISVPRISKEPMRPAGRRYLRTMLPAMGGYVLAIFMLGLFRHEALPIWARVLLALLPVLPIGWVVVAMWRVARDSDELERRIQLESVFVTCGAVGLAAFAVGMLEMARVVHLDAGLFWVLPAMFLVYGIANWRCRRKYGLEGMG